METMSPTLSPPAMKITTGVRAERPIGDSRGPGADRIRPIELTPHSERMPAQEVTVTPRARSERLNRVVSVTLALIGLLILSPLFALIAVAIKLTSPGPICYRQIRVGVNRRRSGANSGPALYDRRACDLGG